MHRTVRRAALAAGLVLPSVPAHAGEELLVRHPMEFVACPQSIAELLVKLDAQPERVRTEIDTGAVLRVKVVSRDANLVFHCSKTAGTLDMLRTTPGEWAETRG